MTNARKMLLPLVMLSLGTAVQAAPATSAPAEQHEQHHTTPARTKTPAKSSAAKVDAQMQRMRQMHEKMMAAKTPEERQALMVEYRDVMNKGMAMMQQMYGQSSKSGRSASMMEMMGMMMTMMQEGVCMHTQGETPAQSAPQ